MASPTTIAMKELSLKMLNERLSSGLYPFGLYPLWIETSIFNGTPVKWHGIDLARGKDKTVYHFHPSPAPAALAPPAPASAPIEPHERPVSKSIIDEWMRLPP